MNIIAARPSSSSSSSSCVVRTRNLQPAEVGSVLFLFRSPRFITILCHSHAHSVRGFLCSRSLSLASIDLALLFSSLVVVIQHVVCLCLRRSVAFCLATITTTTDLGQLVSAVLLSGYTSESTTNSSEFRTAHTLVGHYPAAVQVSSSPRLDVSQHIREGSCRAVLCQVIWPRRRKN